MEEFKKNNKKKNIYKMISFIELFVIILLASTLVFSMGNMKSVSQSSSSKNSSTGSVDDKNTVDMNDTDKTTTSEEGNSAKCYGTYSGGNVTFKLEADGSFTSKINDVSGTTGEFMVVDNTISFIGKKDVTGPEEEDPYYTGEEYVISDDCSYISYNKNGAGKLVSTDYKTGSGISLKSKCTGTYEGHDFKYVLKEDGAFELITIGNNTSGYFKVIGNTISFLGLKHTAGPREEDPWYSSVQHIMSEDCSYMTYIDRTVITRLDRK